MRDSTKRFSDKVRNYVKFRPTYPPDVLGYLRRKGGLTDDSRVVDIGSGTGILTKLLLEEGYVVDAVEPNDEMRHAAEETLNRYPKFNSVAAPGEATTLPSHVAEMVVCATAFHWLDPVKAKVEFARLLKPKGKVALIWNIRRPDVDEFAIEYDQFWRQYDRSEKQEINESLLRSFFTEFESRSFTHFQQFDLEGLIGRSFSSSFSPKEQTKEGDEVITKLTELFNRYQQNEKVRMYYNAKVYIGQMD